MCSHRWGCPGVNSTPTTFLWWNPRPQHHRMWLHLYIGSWEGYLKWNGVKRVGPNPNPIRKYWGHRQLTELRNGRKAATYKPRREASRNQTCKHLDFGLQPLALRQEIPTFVFVSVFCFVFLGPHPWHMDIPRLGVESELQLLAYATARAMADLSHICNPHHCLQPCWIFLSTEQGQGLNLHPVYTGWILNPLIHNGNPRKFVTLTSLSLWLSVMAGLVT